jgi:diadenylate cyclase
MTGNAVNTLLKYAEIESIWDFLRVLFDIAIISYVLYKIFYLLKETRAWQLLKGIALIIAVAKLTELIGFTTLAFILNNTIQYIVLALIVLFQPELRRGLEKIGRSRFKNMFNIEDMEAKNKRTKEVIEEISKTVSGLSENLTGALIVFERDTKLEDWIGTGTVLDANVDADLISNIFYKGSPLHDGAIVIRDDKIRAARCYLPLTQNTNLPTDLGTRHRAAIGITEQSDALSLIVSEETGKISFAENGKFYRILSIDTLRKVLGEYLFEKEKNQQKKIKLWRKKQK